MNGRYSEEQVLEAVSRLTRARLRSFIEAEIVRPLQGEEGGCVFRQIDLARLELMCELCETFDLGEDALGVVMSLIDQLHGLRRELRVVLDVVARDGSDELRRAIGRALRQAEQG